MAFATFVRSHCCNVLLDRSMTGLVVEGTVEDGHFAKIVVSGFGMREGREYMGCNYSSTHIFDKNPSTLPPGYELKQLIEDRNTNIAHLIYRAYILIVLNKDVYNLMKKVIGENSLIVYGPWIFGSRMDELAKAVGEEWNEDVFDGKIDHDQRVMNVGRVLTKWIFYPPVFGKMFTEFNRKFHLFFSNMSLIFGFKMIFYTQVWLNKMRLSAPLLND